MKLHSFLVRICALLLLFSAQVFAAPDFLPPEKAFRVEATWLDNSNQVELEFLPAKGYYIYQESLKFQVGMQAGKLGNVRPPLPPAIEKFDETFQKKLQVYKEPFIVFLDSKPNVGQPIHLEVTLQGCAEAGICYPPMTLKFLLAGPGVKAAPIPDILDDSTKANTQINREGGLFCFGVGVSIYAMRTSHAANFVECNLRHSGW
jgi:thiol:disulfide interchange protein DsbD